MIESMYSCVGLTCDVVGFMPDDDFSRCSDDANKQSLAGYVYGSDLGPVDERARIDIDVRKIEILMANGIAHYSDVDSREQLFRAAFDLYRYGSSSRAGGGSLSRIARDANRDVVPAFESFK